MCAVVPDLAVGGDRRAEGAQARATGAHHELTDAACGIRHGSGTLSCEALVVVAMTAQDNVGTGCIQRVPEISQIRVATFRAEQRFVV